jgi:hypothetical protein
VPALKVDGRHLVAAGKWIRTASIHDEGWLERPCTDPQPYVAALQGLACHLNADIFTFAQRLTDPTPRYPFPMGRDSVAALRLDDPVKWWEVLPQAAR